MPDDNFQSAQAKNVEQIFVSNVLEAYIQQYLSMDSSDHDFWKKYDIVDANRALFYDKDNKIIITTKPINEQHFEQTLNLMGWENVYNLYPGDPTVAISVDIVNNPELREKCIDIIKNNPGIALIPYRVTDEFNAMVDELKALGLEFTTPETMDSKFSFFHQYINTKKGFRHLWIEAVPRKLRENIGLAEGFIAESKFEAINAANWFYNMDKSFVIKFSKGTQGIGIVMFNKDELPSDTAEFVKHMNSKMTEDMWDDGIIVVEELLPIDKSVMGGSPSVEFYIDREGNVTPTYSCEQLLAADKKTFTGVYIHPGLVEHKHIIDANKAGVEWGKYLARYGYSGYYDIDLLITKNNDATQVYAIESNIRRTGGTHVHHTAVNKLGPDYQQHYHVAAEDIHIKYEMTPEQARLILSDLLFSDETKSGVILVNPDMLDVGILNLITITDNADSLSKLRAEVAERLGLI